MLRGESSHNSALVIQYKGILQSWKNIEVLYRPALVEKFYNVVVKFYKVFIGVVENNEEVANKVMDVV